MSKSRADNLLNKQERTSLDTAEGKYYITLKHVQNNVQANV
jgi:hypothetical protein